MVEVDPVEFTIVPTVEFPPTTPFTSHVTVEFEAPVTCALKSCVAPSATVAVDGETTTLTCGMIATVTDAAFDGSAAGVAIIVTEPGDGAVTGAW